MFNDKEILMLEIISSLTNSCKDMVFKGANVTKLVLRDYKYEDVERLTKDIDISWCGVTPSMDYLVGVIDNAVSVVNDMFITKATRMYSDTMTAGISIIDRETGDVVVTLDIDMKPAVFSKYYAYGDFIIRGVIITEILADKITAISTSKIFRRAKDLVDIYMLCCCTSVRSKDIFEIIEKKKHNVGMFTELHDRVDDLEHAYDMLRGVKNKPQFITVYSCVKRFVDPFRGSNYADLAWDNEKFDWAANRNVSASKLKKIGE